MIDLSRGSGIAEKRMLTAARGLGTRKAFMPVFPSTESGTEYPPHAAVSRLLAGQRLTVGGPGDGAAGELVDVE